MRISSELRDRIYTTVHADSTGSSTLPEPEVFGTIHKGEGRNEVQMWGSESDPRTIVVTYADGYAMAEFTSAVEAFTYYNELGDRA